MFYIYVLNYNTCQIQSIMCEEEDRCKDPIDILDDHGLKESEIAYMISDDPLTIETLL